MISSLVVEQFLRLFIATVLGALIGIERDLRDKPAGIRTHMLVCLGSSLVTMVSIYDFPLDAARIAAGIVTGIGFLGAGAIIGDQEGVVGLTTAAGIWVTAGIGMAVGTGNYFLAAMSTLLVVIILFMRIDLRKRPNLGH
jgi:putative Mg2+ transporter-C (MgtC) family protein